MPMGYKKMSHKKNLGSQDDKGKGCILKNNKSDRTYFGDESMNPKGGYVDDNPTRSSTPKVDKPGGGRSYM